MSGSPINASRVLALHTLEQRDPERLHLEPPRAIEGLLPLDIPLDLLPRERSKEHRSGVEVHEPHAAGRPDDRASGIEPRVGAT